MADLADIAGLKAEQESDLAEREIRARAARIPKGEAGECFSCGEYYARIVEGKCAECRDYDEGIIR